MPFVRLPRLDRRSTTTRPRASCSQRRAGRRGATARCETRRGETQPRMVSAQSAGGTVCPLALNCGEHPTPTPPQHLHPLRVACRLTPRATNTHDHTRWCERPRRRARSVVLCPQQRRADTHSYPTGVHCGRGTLNVERETCAAGSVKCGRRPPRDGRTHQLAGSCCCARPITIERTSERRPLPIL